MILRFDIKGVCYDSKTSGSTDARLYNDSPGMAVLEIDGKIYKSFRINELRIDPRIGNTARMVHFPGGISLETDDNDSVDSLARMGSRGKGFLFIHMLESRKRFLFSALVILIILGYLFATEGVPFMARTVAFALPDKSVELISSRVLSIIDDRFLNPSRLSDKKKKAMQRNFRNLVKNIPDKDKRIWNFRLLVRRGGLVGANAFAMPDGTIVMTDELIKLSSSMDELTAVLAHEVGHVVNRHGLRMAIQDSMVTLVIMFVTGDVLSQGSVVTAIPAVMLARGYSRDFEREADRYSLEYMKNTGIDPENFVRILKRLEKDHGTGNKTNLLSTHPSTEERIRLFSQ